MTLVAFGVQNQKVVAQSTSSTVALNTDNLSSFLNKYSGMSNSERNELQQSPEYNDIANALKSMTSIDIMHLDLKQMLSAMANFMRYVPEDDKFAYLIKALFDGYHSIDTRNVNRFWDKSSADSLKTSFNAMRDLMNDSHTYSRVYLFYNSLYKHLMNFIVEYKDGAEFALAAIKDGHFYNFELSTNAKSKIKDFETRAENNAAEAFRKATMEDLAEQYRTLTLSGRLYTEQQWSQREKIKSIFNERLSEEKAKLGQIYGEKTFEALMTLQDGLYKKDLHDQYGANDLHRKWLEAQREVVEDTLLKDLLSNPEMVGELVRRTSFYRRSDFRDKLTNFLTTNDSKLLDYYKKKYKEKQLDVLEDFSAAKSPDANPPINIHRQNANLLINRDGQNDGQNADRTEKNEKLRMALLMILPNNFHQKVDFLFNDIKSGNRGHGTNAKTARRLKEALFEGLLKLKHSLVSNHVKNETKYSILRQFNQLAFQEGSPQDSHEERILDQLSMDLRVAQLMRFHNALSDMVADDDELAEEMQAPGERLEQAIEEAFNQPLSKDLKKQILLETFHSIGSFINFFSDDDVIDDDVFNTMKNMTKQAKLTPDLIKKNLDISGMNKKEEDYRAIMTFTKRLGLSSKKMDNQKVNFVKKTKNKAFYSDETTPDA